jgi:hypothetical protein
MGSHEFFFFGTSCPGTIILPNSISQEAGITSMSHRVLAKYVKKFNESKNILGYWNEQWHRIQQETVFPGS